jgi:hypothetical protein
MSKPAESVLWSDEIQSSCNGLLQVFARVSISAWQKGFRLGENFFNGREIRRIDGQKQETTASCVNGWSEIAPIGKSPES